MDFVPLLVLSAVVKKVVDTLKYATNGDVNALVTQVVTWVTGMVMTWIGANADISKDLAVNGVALGSLNGWSQVLVGFVLASTAAVGWDTMKAIDGSNSAVVPSLLNKLPAARTHEDHPAV